MNAARLLLALRPRGNASKRAPRRVGSLVLACLGVLSILLGAASSTAATPPRKPNDGLPRKWFGITEYLVTTDGVTVGARGTLTYTLVGKIASSPRLTQYTYEPSGKPTVEHHGTYGCTHWAGSVGSKQVTQQLKPLRGIERAGWLQIVVSRRPGKPVRAEYLLGGATEFPDIEVCDGLTFPTYEVITWITSGPPRRMRLTAKILQGTYEDGVRKDGWCLVRSRAYVLKCDLEIGPEP